MAQLPDTTLPLVEPDPRTAADDDEDATGDGVSTPAPAEGGDDAPPEQPGSAEG